MYRYMAAMSCYRFRCGESALALDYKDPKRHRLTMSLCTQIIYDPQFRSAWRSAQRLGRLQGSRVMLSHSFVDRHASPYVAVDWVSRQICPLLWVNNM